MPKFILRLDDFCPTMGTQRLAALEAHLERYGIPALIGIIPDCQDPMLRRFPEIPDFWNRMRRLKAKGWAIAQHGYHHTFDRGAADCLGIERASEFAGHPLEEQKRRLVAGQEILAREGLATDVFMAPCHCFDTTTIRALKETGFRYVTDGAALWPYEQGGLIFVPQLVARAFHIGVGVYTLCAHLDTITDAQFDELLHTIDRHHSRFIRFEDATTMVRDDLIAQATRVLLEKLQYTRHRCRAG